MTAYEVFVTTAGRLDSRLADELHEYSRSAIKKLIRAGHIKVNGAVVRKPAFPVNVRDMIQLIAPEPPTKTLEPQAIPLEILFEDQDVVVVNKAPGMVVHPAPGHEAGTLANAILGHAPEIEALGEAGRPGIVHRLDKDTSGVILVAKHQLALETLQRQFKDRVVKKRYLGLVDGEPPTVRGIIEAPIARDPRRRKRFAIVHSQQARPATTNYQTVERFARHALLEIHPLTGRTHQIRIHLKSIHCPIVGDTVYGRRRATLPVSRHMLHAESISITLPSGPEPRRFEAPLPDDMRDAIQAARLAT